MIVHLFNSGSVSGPERLVLPALQQFSDLEVVFLVEERLGKQGRAALCYAESLGIHCKAIVIRSRYDRAAIGELSEYLKENAPSVLHAHDVKATFYGLIASRKAGGKSAVCSTHHGICGRPDLRSVWYERFYRWCLLPWCNRVLAVSSKDLELLQAVPYLAGKAHLHLNGIRSPLDDDATKERYTTRKRWELEEQTVAIGWVGRLSKEKRPGFLVDVVAQLEQITPSASNWQVCVFGDGNQRQALEQQLVERKLSHRVRLMGYHPEIASELRALDIILNCSAHEGLPISLLEAGHAAIPVCVTATGGIHDLLPDQRFGLTLPPEATPDAFAHQLLKLIENPEQRESLGGALCARVQKLFSETRWSSELLKHYRQLA